MSEQKINPFVVKAAAEMAKPGPWVWFMPDERMRGCVVVNATEAASTYSPVRLLDVHEHASGELLHRYECFNPLTSDDDAMKLERALKGRGWFFGQSYAGPADKRYWAKNGKLGFKEFNESDLVLLLACVALEHSLELFGEGE